ncbi:MAG: hypothetical protein P8186_18680 [Anaerolineae bacterium]
MRIGSYEVKLEKRLTLTNWGAAIISIFAIIFALVLFSLLFILADISPALAYQEIFSYAFVSPFGLPLTINRFIFLLLCTYAFIIPFRAGLWNIGMTGQLYAGALGAFAVVFIFGGKASRNAALAPEILIPLMLIAAALCGAAVGAIAGFLRGKFNVNEIVVTMMLNFIASIPYTRLDLRTSPLRSCLRLGQPCCCTFCSPKPESDIKSRRTGKTRLRPATPG